MNADPPNAPDAPSSAALNAKEKVNITFYPSGKILNAPIGASLQDLLFSEGVEFPCGGHGRCKGCRIRVLEGHLSVTEDDARLLRPEELKEGWRLSCRGRAEGDLKIHLTEWEAPILTDGTTLAFTPQAGLGIAVDLGTTTLVAQLVDLSAGRILSVRSAWNAQAIHGADLMSRIEEAVHRGSDRLTEVIRRQLGAMMRDLFAGMEVSPADVRQIVVVGNTVMHHLFGGLDVSPLAHHPFAPRETNEQRWAAAELGWDEATLGSGMPGRLPADVPIRFLPCLGGFVGSDILAGLLATGLHASEEPAALVDLGTNGELVVGNRERLLCASTAAGPAFEGARISMGMRATNGAIARVNVCEGKLDCRVLGRGIAVGVCGSGLVDAVAAGLELGALRSNGRMMGSGRLDLLHGVHLTQCDIRELQLAKGAIAAGLRLLCRAWGTELERLSRVYLAGAFGNYLNLASARRIGLLPFQTEQIVAAGNTALRGARLALIGGPKASEDYHAIRRQVQHVALHEMPEFQDVYAEEMRLEPCASRASAS